MKKIIKYILFLFIVWFCIHSTIIIFDGLNDEISASDTAVIFGNKIETDGRPSKRLKSRLNKGIELYNKKLIKKIIVSGGLGKEGFEEVDVMKDYLIENHIPENDILADKEGYNTYLTAKNTSKIMKDNDFEAVILVTQYYHISRAELAFKKFGMNQIYSAHANMFPEIKDLYSIPREFVAYYYYLLRK